MTRRVEGGSGGCVAPHRASFLGECREIPIMLLRGPGPFDPHLGEVERVVLNRDEVFEGRT